MQHNISLGQECSLVLAGKAPKLPPVDLLKPITAFDVIVENIDKVKALAKKGCNYSQIGEAFGFSYSTTRAAVYKHDDKELMDLVASNGRNTKVQKAKARTAAIKLMRKAA